MPRHGTESELELTTIERLVALGYAYQHGSELARAPEQVVLLSRLEASLAARYPDLPPAAIAQAAQRFARPEGVDTLRRNLAFHELLRRGIDDLRVEHPPRAAGEPSRVEHRHVYAVDWEHPERNELLVVNQLAIKGRNDRRPDLVVYVNGLPLVVFELKNPWEPEATVEGAWNQIQHYRNDVPQLFDTNGFVVVSDQVNTLHGVWSAGREHYAPWKSIDGEHVEATTTGSMKTLVEGLFRPDRLLAYLRDFLLFEVVADRITKKGAKYHQFFAVRRAVELDESVASEGVVDIFAAAGIERADISILDDDFLQTFKDRPLPDLRVQLLEQLVRRELHRTARQNLVQSRSFQALLEETLRKYHNRLIDAAAVIRAMIEIRRGMEAEGRRAEELGLTGEEAAFYDAIVEHAGGIYQHVFLRDLVHDVVQTVKANLKVDWTEAHREDVKAGVQSAVKRVLIARGVKPGDFGRILPFVMRQAEALYRDWPLVA